MVYIVALQCADPCSAMVVIVVQCRQQDPSMICIISMAVVIHTHEIETKKVYTLTYAHLLKAIRLGVYISSRL